MDPASVGRCHWLRCIAVEGGCGKCPTQQSRLCPVHTSNGRCGTTLRAWDRERALAAHVVARGVIQLARAAGRLDSSGRVAREASLRQE